MRKVFAVMLVLGSFWHVVGAQHTQELTGRVLDAQGNPVAGAQVYFYPTFALNWALAAAGRLPQATTDQEGRYRLPTSLPVSPSVSGVVAFHPQLGCSALSLRDRRSLDLRLQPLTEFHGKVVDETGAPVAGARVHLASIALPGDQIIVAPPVAPFVTMTDARGTFRLPAHTRAFNVLLFVQAPGYQPELHSRSFSWEQLSERGLELSLKRGARITGRLVYAHNGAPVRAYTVFVKRASYATTDENGRFVMDVAADAVTLMPGFSMLSPTLVPPGTFAPVRLEKLLPGTVKDIGTIPVVTEPVVTVVVRDESGLRVPFSLVDIRRSTRPMGDDLRVMGFTDADGQLHIALPDGEYTVTASTEGSDGLPYATREPQRITVRQGEVLEAQPLVITVLHAPRLPLRR